MTAHFPRISILLAAGAALAPTVAGQCQVQKLIGSDSAPADQFGNPVALWDTWAVMGAHFHWGVDVRSGAAYVFQRQGGVWVETQKLEPSDAVAYQNFGSNVVIDGDTILVGAVPDMSYQGAVYVFENSAGTWVETQKLVASDGDPDDWFGSGLALDGGRALIGASYDDDAGARDGSAYVFERVGGTWVETAKITASDAGGGFDFLFFGSALALCGDRALVGATGGADGNEYNVGAAYLFEYTPSSGWQEVQKLVATERSELDRFGGAVALSETWAVVGEPGDDRVDTNAGSVTVFADQGASGWVEVQLLLPPDPGYNAFFGGSLAMEGETLLVSEGDEDLGFKAGAVHVYRVQGSSWSRVGKLLAEDGEAGDSMKVPALHRDLAMVGALGGDGVQDDTGAVYAFQLAPGAVQYCSCPAGAPCGNTDVHGGCATSLGAGALLGACGAASVSADDLVLVSTLLPPQAFDVLFMGAGTGDPLPMGDGLRCVTGTLYRFPVTRADPSGKVVHADLVAQASASFPPGGQITAGSTWYFQDWFRDPQGPCGAASNVTNAVRVTFVP